MQVASEDLRTVERSQHGTSADNYNSTVCLVDHRLKGRMDISLVEGIEFPGLGVYRFESKDAAGAVRNMGHIRADGVDGYLLMVPLREEIELRQDRSRTRVQPGSFAFLSTGRPFESACLAPNHVEYLIKVSGSMLRERVPFIDNCCARDFRIHTASGALLQALLPLALEHGRNLARTCATQLGRTIMESIADATLGDAEMLNLGEAYCKPAHERIRDAALEYVEAHLADPDLSVERIARHCGVSVRWLHAAFAVAGSTVSSHVREKRLLRCRESLLSSAMREKSVTDIAMAWGFNDACHFSRLYRTRFGRAPSDERKSV